ncbi:hypothetical protein BT67DRAFT_380107 [Trichocladium antarcticum]|uniref:Plasma membrane proteolipid 3 n=1 Tax=Trichocladium antarcticum TaxID=1450529 RepID=A0AAN6ZEG8_9PEZI|nr:hypothetical protein BT67DRAFT_380107 [Trichocladium antarcticum]
MSAPFVSGCVLYGSALVVPPLAVYLKKGAKTDLCVNIGLTLLGWVPGMLHALYIVSAS